MLIGLAPSVAGRVHTHQARILAVLHIAAQHAILDKHIAARLRALVINGNGTAAVLDGAVIDNGDALGRDLFADPAAEGRSALAVEVALKPVAHRLVQHYARPAGPKHDFHLACGSRHRPEVHRSNAKRLAHLGLPDFGLHVGIEHHPPAGAGRAGFHAAVL